MENYEKLDFEVNKLSWNELIPMCNEIYDWKYKTGELAKDATLRTFANKIGCENLRHLEDAVLRLCGDNLKKTTLLLFECQPYNFLQVVK